MTEPKPKRYIVWLYGGLFQPAQEGNDDGYPVAEIEALSVGQAARKYVLAHGLQGGAERHVELERKHWVAVALRSPQAGEDDDLFRFQITINMGTEHEG